MKYKCAEPVSVGCDNCGDKTSDFQRVGLWEKEDGFDREDAPRYGVDRALCLVCFVAEHPDVKHFEELAFEGEPEVRVRESLVLHVENTFCSVIHEFPKKRKKFERFTRGDPGTAAPGHGGFYEQEVLDGKKAEVLVLNPYEQKMNKKSGYWYNYVKRKWDGEITEL